MGRRSDGDANQTTTQLVQFVRESDNIERFRHSFIWSPGVAKQPDQSVPALLAQIRELQLASPTQLERMEAISGEVGSAQELCRRLLQEDLLTPFQANRLLAGDAQWLKIGPYRVLERLGEGGIAQVFKARHVRMDRIAAVKVIRPELLANQHTIDRFLREAQAAARLWHPNIVRAYDVDEDDGRYFLAMEWVNGCDLSKWVNQKGPLAVPQAVDYIRQAALGLQHIWEAGLVHRDIKPANLMVAGLSLRTGELTPVEGARWGLLKILDLGLARILEEAEEESRKGGLTALGSVLGTPDYMSPEQATQSGKVDIRSDIYSLGCTFYFLLTGKPPFAGETAVEKLLRHQTETARPVRAVRADVPEPVEAVLTRMMQRNPSDRYAMPIEVAEALVACQQIRSVRVGSMPKQEPSADAKAHTVGSEAELPTEFADIAMSSSQQLRVPSTREPNYVVLWIFLAIVGTGLLLLFLGILLR